MRERIWHFALFPPLYPTTTTPNTIRTLYFLRIITPPCAGEKLHQPETPSHLTRTRKGFSIGATPSLIREALPSRTLLSTVSESREIVFAAMPLVINVGPKSAGRQFRFHPDLDRIVLRMVQADQFTDFERILQTLGQEPTLLRIKQKTFLEDEPIQPWPMRGWRVLEEEFGMPAGWELKGAVNRFGLSFDWPRAMLFVKDTLYVDLPLDQDMTKSYDDERLDAGTEMQPNTDKKAVTDMKKECVAFPLCAGLNHRSHWVCETYPALVRIWMAGESNQWVINPLTCATFRDMVIVYYSNLGGKQVPETKKTEEESLMLTCGGCLEWMREGQPEYTALPYVVPDIVEAAKVPFP